MSESASGEARSGNSSTSEMVFDCGVCGEDVIRYPSQINENDRYFCSKECMGEYQSTHKQISCDYCDSDMSYPEWKIEKSEHHFCCDECFNSWQSEYRTGENHPHWAGDDIKTKCGCCGCDMSVRPHRYEKAEVVFCSNECFRTWHSETLRGENASRWLGGHRKYRGANWERQRQITRRRDDHQCRVCGKGKGEVGRKLDVHHITRFRKFDSYKDANRLWNLISLCPHHHGLAESGAISKEELYNLVPNNMELTDF